MLGRRDPLLRLWKAQSPAAFASVVGPPFDHGQT